MDQIIAGYICVLLIAFNHNAMARECEFESNDTSSNPYQLNLHKFKGQTLTYTARGYDTSGVLNDVKFFYTVCSNTSNGDNGMIVSDSPFGGPYAYWDNGEIKPMYDYSNSRWIFTYEYNLYNNNITATIYWTCDESIHKYLVIGASIDGYAMSIDIATKWACLGYNTGRITDNTYKWIMIVCIILCSLSLICIFILFYKSYKKMNKNAIPVDINGGYDDYVRDVQQ